MSYIKNLSEVGRKDTKLVGGKAASLGEMINKGLPVPEGFVITTEGFHAGITKELEQKILKAFDGLSVEQVAVRSSAVAEDSSNASWAGQLESYLNVSKDGVINAVERCWQSIKSTRAKHYADEHHVEQSGRAVAVVVQKMVDSEISGVIFTANPVTGNRDEIMIEAVYGLGEMIVQGVVTPESIVIDKKAGNITSRSKHRQIKQLVYKNDENVEIPVGTELQGKDILTDKLKKELIYLAYRIEHHYSFPQDIEWAFADNQFYILQSRPITTLLSKSPKERDNLPFSENTEIFRWGPIRGHYFYISDYTAACYDNFHKNYKNEIFPQTLLLFKNEHMVWLSVLDKWQTTGQHLFTKYIENPSTLSQLKQEWQQSADELVQFQISIIPARIEKISNVAFINLWHEFYAKMINFWTPTLLPELGNYGAPDLLKQDLAKFINDDEELVQAQEILTAPETLSFYQQEELQLIESSDIKAHHAKYFWLKNSYGNVEVLDEMFFKARQSDLIKSIKAPSQRELRLATQTAKEGVQSRYKLPSKLMAQAKLISDNIVWQDQRKRIMSENFHYKKLLLEELARRTKKSFGDLLNLGFDEVIQLLSDNKPKKNKTFHGVQFQNELIRLSAKQAELYWEKYAHHKLSVVDSIQGIIASTGKKAVVKGRVRVLRSSHDIIKPGEILVTAMTSLGYVFAMRRAAAIITDIGGPTSHSAIVAREIGVPCIMGTKIATQALKTGDMVKIDVLRGIIKIINEENNG